MDNGKRFAKVIVAFDGSNDSIKAIELAQSLATTYGSEVTVVHVYSSPAIGFSAASGIPIPDYREIEEAKKDAARAVLTKGVQLASEKGLKAKGELIEASSVVEAIVEFAASEKADLIVVGTRGMTGFKKLILGSVSSGLVNHSPCPVLIAR
jgi:nucleotide-binding universal stress UspA family protein